MLNTHQLLSINWEKVNGLMPCIIQHFISGEVLMHGYMNDKALDDTQRHKIVTFYSRTREKLWIKGGKSGHFLHVLKMNIDCDCDVLLILANSINLTCHIQKSSCFFGEKTHFTYLFYLDKIIKNKKYLKYNSSYTTSLHQQGINRISQKVGEEVVEVVISVLNKNKIDFINESSDLIYHLLVLLHNQNLDFNDLINNLRNRRIHKNINK
ncbi:Histidine biosynthesis bifunctional protein HisIE [Buchnera aphidicola (Phyllaphis fagi)]|uniref:bifunctional phosphoribosyl-AMP cyclohydrolase/phosphoribosyl-ATP diphosphatase HisIE n=1 Tax=Buchnera aphidicola TaxID=9 RepID=UPI003463CDBB